MALACIIPDKGIIVLAPCGKPWCAEATNAFAMNDEDQPIQIQETVNGQPAFVERCGCFNAEDQAILAQGDENSQAFQR